MKNNSNIYDIDGNLIRQSGDTHKFTIEEAQSRANHYRELLKELNEKENLTQEEKKKKEAYKVYLDNLSNFILYKYSEMSLEEIKQQLGSIASKTSSEDIEKALNDLKDDTETRENTENEISNNIATDTESTANEKSRNDEVVDGGISDVHEERPVSQSDLLVERDKVNTVMDEYVNFTEE